MLDMIFKNCADLMKRNAYIYVRTDCRDFTRETTISILKKYFPHHSMQTIERPLQKNIITQTIIHGNFSKKQGEVDVILKPIT